MNKEELHSIISNNQSNICQIVAYKDGKKIYSDEWNDYKVDDKELDYFPDYYNQAFAYHESSLQMQGCSLDEGL